MTQAKQEEKAVMGQYDLDDNHFQDFKNKGALCSTVKVECIDGRRGGDVGEKVICIPGGGLGVLAEVYTALEHADHNGEIFKDKEAAEKVIFETVKEVLGGEISSHTDDHEHTHPHVFSGCGHCLGIVSRPEYEASHNLKNFIKKVEEYLNPVMYKGHHKEEGVVMFHSTNKSVPSIVDDKQHFVYHTTWHSEILNQIAEKLSSAFNIAKDFLLEILKKISEKFVGTTVGRLAGHLIAENKVIAA